MVKFGDFSQDVLTEIGCPDRTHYKSEDKMKIHLGQKSDHITDYFYNYFNLGVDLVCIYENNLIRISFNWFSFSTEKRIK